MLLLTAMAVTISASAADVDTLWVEVPDTTVVKARRAVVEEKHQKIEEPIFFKIRESNTHEATGIDVAIKKVAGLLSQMTDATFTVTGYADKGTGNAELNKMYAKRRAEDVTRVLIEEYGLNPANLKSDSKGDLVQPFEENDKNRCVIITGEGTLKVTRYEDYDSLVVTTRRMPQLLAREEKHEEVDECIPRREFLSVKTNVLLDVAYMPGYNRWCPIPNVAVEYYPQQGHFTFGASVDFPWWKHYHKYKFFELRNYQLETRYYLRSGDVHHNPPGRGAAFRGWYLQGYAHGGLFLFCFNKDKGWTGEYLGGGLGFGYVTPLSKKGHWRLELGAQFGIIYAGYDPFQYEYRGSVDLNDDLYYYDWTLPAAEFKKRQYRYTWFGPTRIGITISYDLLYRRHGKKGVSFKSYQQTERRYGE